jgi:hypothetical protein
VEQQAAGRGVVEQLITRTAQAMVGAALLAASMHHDLAPEMLAGAACTLAFGWLVVGSGIRSPYVERFRLALSRGIIERDFKLAKLDLTSLETVVEALARPQPGDVVAAMNVLAERKRDRLIPALILHHDSEEVLSRALELFGSSKRTDWFELGERLTRRLEYARLRCARSPRRARATCSNAPQITPMPSFERSQTSIWRSFWATLSKGIRSAGRFFARTGPNTGSSSPSSSRWSCIPPHRRLPSCSDSRSFPSFRVP